jgi:hypothetical protein
MGLPNDFPEKASLEKEGYDSIQSVSEATDEELLEVKGITGDSLAGIRSKAPYKPSDDEVGTGATSGKTGRSDAPGKASTKEGPEGSVDPTSESYEAQTSKKSKNQVDPITGEPLPEGITVNERGTLTASSEVEQNDMVSPKQVKDERDAALRREGEKISALLGSTNR